MRFTLKICQTWSCQRVYSWNENAKWTEILGAHKHQNVSWKWVIFGEIYSILGHVISTSKLAQVESIFLHFPPRVLLVRLNVVFVNGSLVAIDRRLNSSELLKKGLCIHLNQAAGMLLNSNKCSTHDNDSMFLKIHYIYNTNIFNQFIIIEFCKRAYSLVNSILFELSFKPTVSCVCQNRKMPI